MAAASEGRQPTQAARGGDEAPSESGPYVLRALLEDVRLSADGGDEDIKINCVDYLGTFGLRAWCVVDEGD